MDNVNERAQQRLAAIHREWQAIGPRSGDLAVVSCPACWNLTRYLSATQARCTHCGILLELSVTPPAPEEAGGGRSTQEKASGGLPAQHAAPIEHIREHWEQIRQRCKTRSPMIAALLSSASPGGVSMTEQHGYAVICEVEFQYHLKRLQTPEAQAIVAWAIRDIIGAPYGVQFVAKRPALQGGPRPL
jgi:hypothetical protein